MDLNLKAYELRKDIVDIIMAGGGGHIGGDMSVIEILTALYYDRMNISPDNTDDPERDRFVLSKGHCMEAYYAVLADRGFLNLNDIKDRYSKYQSPYIGHPNNKLKGIEMNSGSLGHGLSVCVGMALAGKKNNSRYRVYTVMGDGELAEGSVWEGFMAGAHYGLDNLCTVIDKNNLQISGFTKDVMSSDDLNEKLTAFGWNVIEVEKGNDVYAVADALKKAEEVKGKPTAVIAHTVKGCGSLLMENKAGWHHKVPNSEEYARIISDFRLRAEEVHHE
ncbi:MAG: transketolase [Parasporobacterium sp.]|nr:transketolase [Parasporobacterium sp.]